MVDRSPELIWGLTKKFNAEKKRWMGKDWTTSVFSTNGMHNASQSANILGISGRKEKTEKGAKKVFTLTLKHKAKTGIQKRKVKSASNPATSVQDLRRDVNGAAKAIQGVTLASEAEKKAALRKLAKLSKANGTKKTE